MQATIHALQQMAKEKQGRLERNPDGDEPTEADRIDLGFLLLAADDDERDEDEVYT